MDDHPLPLLHVGRVLVPGTRASLPCTDAGLERGQDVVTIFARAAGAERPAGRVATLARVEGVRPLAPGARLLRLRGCRLVRLTEARFAAGRWWAGVAEISEPGPGAGPLLDEVERSLTRYLALGTEAGESGLGLVELNRDPVAASHQVASLLRISWPEVQDILEAGTAVDRLRRARAVLDRETELLRRLLGREGK